eukprot:CAMPEP_0180431624 /NCGR_PEP_ID=MMETSP1036_2-20121128/8494_1 /TAXON_ID=632150 /ORGANISM="Azadinium spinosum, Strain 3D9" /LENGTH=338 /DNA_ID=CAMNT_0022437389 /DNA_START=428 /DNA_END=1441 /DNA_ORIENTATION=-
MAEDAFNEDAEMLKSMEADAKRARKSLVEQSHHEEVSSEENLGLSGVEAKQRALAELAQVPPASKQAASGPSGDTLPPSPPVGSQPGSQAPVAAPPAMPPTAQSDAAPKTGTSPPSDTDDLSRRLAHLEYCMEKEMTAIHSGLIEVLPNAKTTPWQFHREHLPPEIRRKICLAPGVVRIFAVDLTLYVEVQDDSAKQMVINKLKDILSGKPLRIAWSETFATKSIERPCQMAHSMIKNGFKEKGGKWPLSAALTALSPKSRRDMNWGIVFKGMTLVRAFPKDGILYIFCKKSWNMDGIEMNGDSLAKSLLDKIRGLQGFPWAVSLKITAGDLPAPYTE